MELNLSSITSSLFRNVGTTGDGDFSLAGGQDTAADGTGSAGGSTSVGPLVLASAGAVPPNPFDGKIAFDSPQDAARAGYEYIFAKYGERLKGQEFGFEFIQGEDGKFRLGKLIEGEERRVSTELSILLPGENPRFADRQAGAHTHPAPDGVDEDPTFSGPDFGTLLDTKPDPDGVRRQSLMAPDGHMFMLELAENSTYPLTLRETMSSLSMDRQDELKKWAEEALKSGELKVTYLGNADPSNNEPAPPFNFMIGISDVTITVPPEQQRRAD